MIYFARYAVVKLNFHLNPLLKMPSGIISIEYIPCKEEFMRKLSLLVVLTMALAVPAYSQQNAKKEAAMLLDNEKNSISVFQNTADSVVNVSNLRKSKGMFDMDATEIQAGMGSGLVWDTSGHIITNYHVVDGGDSFTVAFREDQKQYKAKLIGGDPKNDIAVLKLLELPKNLKPIIPGDSRTLLVGQKTLAIGNPLGLDHTLTTGSVSALGRKIKGFGGVSINGMIQTDASINPGNSGGALLDSQGRLIGMNAMIYNAGGAGASAGLGFAIPVATIKDIVPQIIQYGRVIRPGLGVAILEDYYAARFGLREGVMVKFVDPKGPAGKAGLQGITRDRFGQYYIGDIIVGINTDSIKNYDDLYSTVNKYKIGDKVKVKIVRDGKERTVDVTLVQI
ncbi:2-alkenal reductase [Bacteriovorax stolpii]|uniref:2-alkenal reductase n=2 Tax=Bacteriovorax stolpii TaxID=960 RepID=A0A2K9NMR8_BACTC|nr:2-alkenal reductase [Bacteriovorax stolpii]